MYTLDDSIEEKIKILIERDVELAGFDESKHPRELGGAGSGNIGHAGIVGHQGGSLPRGAAGGSVIGFRDASHSFAKQVNSEWSDIYPNEPEGPFWDPSGYDGARYWIAKDENGKMIAGMTTAMVGDATEILSIGSHSPGAGVELLDLLKNEGKPIYAVASSKKSIDWFIRNGFELIKNRKRGMPNVKWDGQNNLGAFHLS